MNEFKQWVAARLVDIQAEIDSLPVDCRSERNADGLGIDLEFYRTSLEVVKDYEDEKAFVLRNASQMSQTVV